MANFSSLKQAIQNYIKENGNKEITGNLLQEILLSMVVTMGDNAINSLTTVVNELNTILHSVDAEPTKNSVNLVRSGGVWSGINREALRAFNAETFEARFNSTNNRVEFFNQSGDMLYWYDASAFVTTGLVEDVYIENDNLVFVINTSAGEKTIEVPLEDVFNPNNYYTKTQIDDIVRTIRELYDGAEYRGFITPSSQAESKQGVKMVCFATEAGTYTNFLANYDTPIVIPVRGIWVFERGVDADDWTAYSLLEIDKVYAPAQASGMGRVVLQKNMVNGVNTITQDMFYKGEVGSRVLNTNTIFVIEYDFTLGEDITVPANCVLEFDGGSITGAYTITGANTGIQAGLVKILGTDVTLGGTWNVAEAYPEWFGAKGDDTIDCTIAIQKTIDSFSYCYFYKGNYKITSYINVTGNIYGQYSKTVIKPYHDGDVFRLTVPNKSIIGITIKGGEWNGPNTQPRIGTPGAAFVIGYNGANAQNCRIQDCTIYVYYGNGITWEHGSKMLLDNVTVNKATGDGIVCTSNYGDNNEGTFLNTHIMNCSGIGYNIVGCTDIHDDKNSRCHHFVNAKSFGNRQNYYINSIGNNGTIMSEHGSEADVLDVGAQGNYILVYSTAGNRVGMIDNGLGNTISGYDTWATWKDSKRYVEELHINKRLRGYQILRQTANDTFEDTIDDKNQHVKVYHSKGNGASRQDIFDGGVNCVGLGDTFEVADSAWYSPFRPAGSNRDGGPHPFKVLNTKDGQTRFTNGFEVCPESFSGNPSWCMGSKDEIPLRCFIGNTEIWNGTKTDGMQVLVDGQKASPAILLSGTKANAPTVTKVGFMYFCTDITPARPIYWNGSAWVDATGTPV